MTGYYGKEKILARGKTVAVGIDVVWSKNSNSLFL